MTTWRSGLYTLSVLDPDGGVQLLLQVDGPLPEALVSLSDRASKGDAAATRDYVSAFIEYWHTRAHSSWARVGGLPQ